MFHIVAEIGKTVLLSEKNEGADLEILIQEDRTLHYIVALDFSLQKGKIKFEPKHFPAKEGKEKEPIPFGKLKEYLHLGNEKGSSGQFSCTTRNLKYLLTQSIFNLEQSLLEGSDLKRKLKSVLSTFFLKGEDKKHPYLLRDDLFQNLEVEFEVGDNRKKSVENFAKDIEAGLSQRDFLKAGEILYTVLIDGIPISQFKDYQNLVREKKLEASIEKGKKGICTICGKLTKTTTDLTRLQFKFYITDKINFASHFEKKNFYKALELCRECYRQIIVGEKWIQTHLKSRLGGFELYILPQLTQGLEEPQRLKKYLEETCGEFEISKNLRRIQELERSAPKKAMDRKGIPFNPFIWNFLFYRPSANSDFKVLTVIRDVPPYRMLALRKQTNQIDGIRQKYFPDSITFDLERIFYLIPIKTSQGKPKEVKKILQIYYNIIAGHPLEKSQLYAFYANLAHIHHFGSYGTYQIKSPGNPEFALASDTIKWNLFLLFLEQLHLIPERRILMNKEEDRHYPEGMVDFFEDFHYNPLQQSLALLGYVLGVVAWKQQRDAKLKSKPILKKINYQGMTSEKVIRLFNELFEKIRQYKIGFAEIWWAKARRLYDEGREERASADERVFYILSGYAFQLTRPWEKKEEKTDEEIESIQS